MNRIWSWTGEVWSKKGEQLWLPTMVNNICKNLRLLHSQMALQTMWTILHTVAQWNIPDAKNLKVIRTRRQLKELNNFTHVNANFIKVWIIAHRLGWFLLCASCFYGGPACCRNLCSCFRSSVLRSGCSARAHSASIYPAVGGVFHTVYWRVCINRLSTLSWLGVCTRTFWQTKFSSAIVFFFHTKYYFSPVGNWC